MFRGFIRHGRDHKLRVWKMRANDEGLLDKVLPVERGKEPRAETVLQPWLIHSLSVNALNFCAFSLCFIEGLCHDKQKIGFVEPPKKVDTSGTKNSAASSDKTPQQVSMLIAAPNALNAGGVDIFHLPTERRVSTIAADSSTQTGMIMAVNIFLSSSGVLYVVSGFEDGHVMAHVRRGMLTLLDARHHDTSIWKWDKIYSARPHTQPVLSLDVSPANDYFLTSSADALLIKHPIPDILLGDEPPEMERNTPLRVLNTKHAGQQGLRIRSDGKVFATAGWDSKIRVYSSKTMKELAVLKWHKEGCCAVAFAGVCIETIPISRPVRDQNVSSEDDKREGTPEGDSAQVEKMNSLRDIQRQRSEKAQLTHWLAAGSKDGKTTLWEIY